MKEVTVRIKDEQTTIVEKFLVYEDLTVSHDDHLMKKMVEQAFAKVKVPLNDPDVTIKIKYLW